MSTIRIQSVTNRPCANAIFMVLGLLADQSHWPVVLDFASNFSALIRSLNHRFPDAGFSAVMGFGSNAWDMLFPNQPKPKELMPFEAIIGKKYTAVATPGDLFFHIRATTQDICYELASIIHFRLKHTTYFIDETHSFRYFDGRSILGFVDGTENPEAILSDQYAVIGNEDQFFKGGSYAFVQKYLHDMDTWNALSDEEQEKVIGRKKYSDLELDEATKPSTAHNAVSKAYDQDGNELKIVRANMPFAYPAKNEYGTVFIGYARSFSTIKQMLQNMFVGNDKLVMDSLLDYSSPITGTLFFIPTLDFLDDLGGK